MRELLLAATAACVAVSSASACGSGRIQTCGVIPAAGCPIGRGGTCDDLECEALYECAAGNWVLASVCDQAASAGAGVGSGGAAGGAGGAMCNGVELDHTGEIESCSPPLQNPDCPAGAAELCRPCDTGCIDFFMCRNDGWSAVAFCDEDGNVVVEP